MGITKRQALMYPKEDALPVRQDLTVSELVDLAVPSISRKLRREYALNGDVVIIPWFIIDASREGVLEEVRRRYPGWTINPSAPEGDSLFFS